MKKMMASKHTNGRAALKPLRHARTRFARALMEIMEPRILLSGTYLVGDLTGTWSLGGLDKAGSLTFDGNGAITAGSWTNQDGSPVSQVVPGLGSVDTVSTGGVVGLTVTTVPTGGTTSTTTTLTGAMNATKDVVALSEETTVGPLTTVNGLDLLVNPTGNFATSDLAGTWNVAGEDFRGTVTINGNGHVTGGSIFLESNQHVASITGGTADLGTDGTGTLTFTTGFSGANAAFHSMSLNITMNSAMDTVVGNASNIGQAQSAPLTSPAPAELVVMLKSSGVYKKTDITGTTWTLASAQGAGTFMFNANGTVSGSLTKNDGTVAAISGNYTLGGNGTLITNLTLTANGHKSTLSLFGAVNRSKNTIALDRAIQNPQNTGSSLTVLINPANHAPTERALAVLPVTSSGQSSVGIDYDMLNQALMPHDLDNDTLGFLITSVPAASGGLTYTHDDVTLPVIPGTTIIEMGDTLTWTPAPGASGQVNAFTVEATDGTADSNESQIVISTSALPVVSVIGKGSALEADAGKNGGRGTFVIQRAGGNQAADLSVTINVSGGAVEGTNYQLIGPDGHTEITTSTAQITIPAGQNSVTLTVVPLQDGVVDPTLEAVITVEPDPNSESIAYTPSDHNIAHVDVIDSNPLVTITPRIPAIIEGASDVRTFIVTRLAAQGGNLDGDTVVNLAYSGSFDIADHLVDPPTSVTFTPGEVKKVITLTTTSDGIADPSPQTIAATISGNDFFTTGGGQATVNVIDSSPVVSITVPRPIALEAAPTTRFGEFIIHRTGSTAAAETVDFTLAAGDTDGVLNTNFTLTDGAGNSLTDSVQIPAGSDHVDVFVTPIDDGMNDSTLHANLTLHQDTASSYFVSSALSVGDVSILNDNRFPIVTQGTVLDTSPRDTALTLTFDQLTAQMGASLAAGETHGTLQLTIDSSIIGTLQIIRSGSDTPIAATDGLGLGEGDSLVWTPPNGLHGNKIPAFTLSAVDGTLTSLRSSLFKVTLT